MDLHYFYHSGLLGAACLLSPAYRGLMADSIDTFSPNVILRKIGAFPV